MSEESKVNLVEDLIMRTDQQDGFVGLPLVRQGTVGVVLRNGRVEKILEPGRQFMFRLPFQVVETVLVDTKIRNLDVISQGEFLTVDQRRVNVSLSVSYQVIDPARVAVEYAQPVHTFYSKIKDLLGQVINQQSFQTLAQSGRQIVRQQILQSAHEVQAMGLNLIDVRINDLTLPDRVGAALDESQVARLEGDAAQQRLRGKWQDLPEDVRRYHLQEQVAQGGVFINPPLSGAGLIGPGIAPGGVPGGYPPGGYSPQIGAPGGAPPSLPPAQPQIIDQPAATRMLGGSGLWGQLVVIGGPQQGQVFPLQKPSISIGRAPQCDVALTDSSVSGRHASLEKSGPQTVLQDLNSSNGTWINQMRVTQPVALNGGETIILGNTAVRFERF